MSWRGVFLLDQVLRSGQHVINRVLLGQFLAGGGH
jgi:hypothetical protein